MSGKERRPEQPRYRSKGTQGSPSGQGQNSPIQEKHSEESEADSHPNSPSSIESGTEGEPISTEQTPDNTPQKSRVSSVLPVYTPTQDEISEKIEQMIAIRLMDERKEWERSRDRYHSELQTKIGRAHV